MLQIGLFVLLSYLIGSIPTAFWMGKIFRGIDIREHGSGNSGATNSLRVMGWQFAVPTLIIDAFKGYAVTLFASCIDLPVGMEEMHFRAIFGIVAAGGHVFPVFAGFRGGKGIATFSGVVTGVSAWALAFCLPVFLIVTAITRYVSVGSIATAMVLPFFFYFYSGHNWWMCLAGVIMLLFVIYTHRNNIRRLIRGEENKVSFKKK